LPHEPEHNIENVTPLTEEEVNAIIANMKAREGETEVEFQLGVKKIMVRIRDEVKAGGELRISADALRKSWKNWKINFVINKNATKGMDGINKVSKVIGARGGKPSGQLSVKNALVHLAGSDKFLSLLKRKPEPDPEPIIDIDNLPLLAEEDVNAIIDDMKPREGETKLDFQLGVKKVMERLRDEVNAGGEYRITSNALRKSWKNWKINFGFFKNAKKVINKVSGVIGARGGKPSGQLSVKKALLHLAGREASVDHVEVERLRRSKRNEPEREIM